MKTGIILLFCLSMITAAVPVHAKNIRLTIDERNWYPFTFVKNNSPEGMHVELVKKAFENLGYSISIDYLPRKRCLFSIENGSIDAMISISYNQEVAKSMAFPEDAANPGESQWRIMQVDHVVVTPKSSFEFDGKVESLPEPVRIPSGESITAYIEASGRIIDEAKTDEQNFGKMLRDMNGCVITTTMLAEKTAARPEYRGKMDIHATPLASHSYHIGFSKKSNISSEEKQKIWEETRKLRNDYVFMLQLYSLY